MPWYRVCPAEELGPSSIVAFDDLRDDGIELVVWRTAGGVAVACDARCPHQWSHLAAEGAVDGDELVCTAHFWRFDATGEGTKLNVKGRRDVKAPVVVHPIREHEGWVEVAVDRPTGRRGSGDPRP